jgi:DNA-binding NarL/FixJ family response regulator
VVAVLAPVVSVVVVDARRLVREGLAALLSTRSEVEVSAVSGSWPRTIERSAVCVVGEVAGTPPAASEGGVRIVALTGVVGLDDLVAMIVAGAEAMPAVRVAERPAATGPLGVALTRRERLVLRAVSQGGSASRIAAELGISARTVERHTQSAMAKLGARNQARAVARSLELGLFEDAV